MNKNKTITVLNVYRCTDYVFTKKKEVLKTKRLACNNINRLQFCINIRIIQNVGS